MKSNDFVCTIRVFRLSKVRGETNKALRCDPFALVLEADLF